MAPVQRTNDENIPVFFFWCFQDLLLTFRISDFNPNMPPPPPVVAFVAVGLAVRVDVGCHPSFVVKPILVNLLALRMSLAFSCFLPNPPSAIRDRESVSEAGAVETRVRGMIPIMSSSSSSPVPAGRNAALAVAVSGSGVRERMVG